MKNFIEKFRKGLFTKAQFLTGVSIVALTTSALVYAIQAINLTVFTSGTPISAAQVNTNFQQLADAINQANNKFSVALSSNVPYTSSYTTVNFNNFDSTVYDFTQHSYAASLVANGNFVVQEDGLYEWTLIGFNTASGCCNDLQAWRNGTSFIYLSLNSGKPEVSNFQGFFNSGDIVSFTFYEGADGAFGAEKNRFIFQKVE